MFEELFTSAFPEHERRSIAGMRRVIENEAYNLELFFVGDVFVGFISYWQFESYLFGEYIAICPNLRDMGIGKLIISYYLDKVIRLGIKAFIIEIDMPTDDISIRRYDYMRRLGFVESDFRYHSIAFRPPHKPYRLLLLSYPIPIDDLTAQRFQDFVHNVVVKEYQ